MCVNVRLDKVKKNQAEFPQWIIIFLIEALFHGTLPRGTIQVIAQ